MLNEGDNAPAFSARPIFGAPIVIPGADPRPLVLAFVGSLASPFTRRWLSMLQERFADFDRSGARVAAIARADEIAAQDFVPRFHLLFPLAVDPDGDIAAQYGVGVDRMLLGSLRHGLLGELRGALGHGVGWGRGSIRTLPAAFVIRGSTIESVGYSKSISDTPDMEALIRCAAPS